MSLSMEGWHADIFSAHFIHFILSRNSQLLLLQIIEDTQFSIFNSLYQIKTRKLTKFIAKYLIKSVFFYVTNHYQQFYNIKLAFFVKTKSVIILVNSLIQ